MAESVWKREDTGEEVSSSEAVRIMDAYASIYESPYIYEDDDIEYEY